MLAGNFAGLPTDTLNFYSGAYLVARALYTVRLSLVAPSPAPFSSSSLRSQLR